MTTDGLKEKWEIVVNDGRASLVRTGKPVPWRQRRSCIKFFFSPKKTESMYVMNITDRERIRIIEKGKEEGEGD